jgi:hypothetical protein
MNDETNQVTRLADICARLLKYAERSTQGIAALERRQLHDASPDLFIRPTTNQRDALILFCQARQALLFMPLMGPLTEEQLDKRLEKARSARAIARGYETQSSAARNLSTSGRGL